MEILSKIYDTIILINKDILGFIFFFLLLYFLFTIIKNTITKCSYKRERNGNDKKFSAKRCSEDSTRDYIYLVDEKNKEYYRIVNLYTLSNLGYPRPSRGEACFKLSDGYVLKNEIKIYNLFSDIKDIIKLKYD